MDWILKAFPPDGNHKSKKVQAEVVYAPIFGHEHVTAIAETEKGGGMIYLLTGTVTVQITSLDRSGEELGADDGMSMNDMTMESNGLSNVRMILAEIKKIEPRMIGSSSTASTNICFAARSRHLRWGLKEC